MGKDFFEHSDVVKERFLQASNILNLDMEELCFSPNDKLDITEYTQAALLTTSLAMAEVVKEKGIIPEVTAGLSLGEYCAIVTAGAMRFADAVYIVRKRGILMQNAVAPGEGAMAAVIGLKGEQIEAVLANIEGVSIANYNCPGQIVITGTTRGVQEASAQLKETGARRVIPLNVSGPFHSPMLRGAGKELLSVLDEVEIKDLNIPYLTNVTGEYVRNSHEIKDLLAAQVAASVRWEQSVENMIADGIDTFIEIGPGKTLTGFIRKINADVKTYNIETWENMESVVQALSEGK